MVLKVQEHIRISCIGSLPGDEMFSFGLSLGRIDSAFISNAFDPGDDSWDDMTEDLLTFWNSIPIAPGARFQTVKYAFINDQGEYARPAVERAVGAGASPPGVAGQGPAGYTTPNQVALAVTLHTAGDLGRVKGRFFLPTPALPVGADGRFVEASRDAVETAAALLITNLNNEPWMDTLGTHVVVPSRGRHFSDGSVKLPPKNYDVTGVTVGRVLDTQRRRRNKLTEFRGTPTSLGN